jgi:hypothetical protein
MSYENLLEAFLSTQPILTQKQQRARFASIQFNFEFGFFIAKNMAESIANEAMGMGFTVWGNIDSSSAFLYGAGLVDQIQFTDIINWLRNSATQGQKINVGIHNPSEQMKLVQIDV